MLRKLNKIVQQSIVANYNKMEKKGATFEDAAFFTFLDWIEKILFSLFFIFAFISFTLLIKKEILPLLWY